MARMIGRMVGLLILACVGLAGLTACGPIYDTKYTFTPPSDEDGKREIRHCRSEQRLCQQSCELREQSCKMEARSRGMMEYQWYVNQRRKEGAQIKRSPESFVSDYHCSNSQCEARCDSDYRGCYQDAGGQIKSSRVCVAFCDQR